MKKQYNIPALDIVKLEDKPSISMNTNNQKTFNEASLEDSCGYEELAEVVGEQIGQIPIDEIPGLIEEVVGFEIVAS